jgi:hypothetical protein
MEDSLLLAWRRRFDWGLSGPLAAPPMLMLVLAATLAGAMPRKALAEESEIKIEAQYQNEHDPVRKAKLLAKLGPLEVKRVRDYLEMDDEGHALSTLEHFRDEVRDTTGALSAAKADAEKHPSGYKELQIGLRETIRRLNDIVLAVPVEERPMFEAVRSDLTAMQGELFEALFPTATEKRDNKKAQQ